MFRREKFKTFIIIFILSGLYIFIFSESGIIERNELNKKYKRLNQKIGYIKADNERLLKECDKYRSGNYNDTDIINSGLVYKTGKFIYIDDRVKEVVPDTGINPGDFSISPEHLRIIWIIISVMYLFYHFLKKNKSEDLTDGPDFN